MEFLIDPPWWLPATIAAVGIGLFVWGNNRLRPREKWIGIGVVCAAVLLMLAAYFLASSRETVERQTRELVQDVVDQDANGIAGVLDPEAVAFGWNRQDIIDGAVHYAGETGLTGARIMGLKVENQGRDLVSLLSVWSQHTGRGNMPVSDLNSQWRLLWVKTDDRWLLLEITPVQIGPMQQDAIEQQYFSRPVQPRGR